MGIHNSNQTRCASLGGVKIAFVFCSIFVCVYGENNSVIPLGVYVGTSLNECILKCASKPSCTYIGYARFGHICSLYSTKLNNPVESGFNHGSIYVLKKADFDTTYAEVIQSVSGFLYNLTNMFSLGKYIMILFYFPTLVRKVYNGMCGHNVQGSNYV